MGTGGEIHFLHRIFEVAIVILFEQVTLVPLARASRRVRRIGRFPESLKLDSARGDHPMPDGFRGFSDVRVGGQFVEVHQWHLAMEVDPFQ